MAKLSNKTIKAKELITLEELGWLVAGLSFGYLAGLGAPIFVIAIPIAAFLIWIFEYFRRKALW
ncbi:MAG: hypothetical protein AABW84_00465 [Nanoarchaeota archaeon]